MFDLLMVMRRLWDAVRGENRRAKIQTRVIMQGIVEHLFTPILIEGLIERREE